MTSKKSLLFYMFSVIVLAALFSYSLVFAVPIKNNEYIFETASNNIFVDSLELHSNMVVTNKHFSDFEITGECGVFGKLVSQNNDFSVFEIKVLDTTCDKEKLTVTFNLGGSLIDQDFYIISSFDLYTTLLDTKNSSLKKSINSLNDHILKYTGKQDFKAKRKVREYVYLQKFIQDILDKREKKYKIPVLGAKIPTSYGKVPNTPRPYRASYTDGIHHGWDFDANKGDAVVALDDGMVIKVVDNFLFSDLGNINKSKNLRYEDQLYNLNILRGNQVWIKTMKGDVAFYSHLDTVFDEIKVGMVVSKGQPIGTVGSTGVPDKNYHDYHLHISIQKNPYDDRKIGKYNELDYMKWDWSFKGEDVASVIQKGGILFEK